VLARDREALGRVGERDADRVPRAAGVDRLQLGAPAREQALGVAGGAGLVGDVVGRGGSPSRSWTRRGA